ncbi:DUF1573 domain-containing protein [bacterium]|nr:DUF1573 domain-containing protein [bacterium]
MPTIFVSALSLICAALSTSAADVATPQIQCEEATFDFGSRDAAESVEHTFLVKNTGTADLEIKKVQPACGCTTAELEKNIIPPGDSAKVAAKLSLAGRSGEVQKPINIESNDPTNPTLQLLIKGIVSADFQISPNTMMLQKDSPQALASASVIVKSLKNEPFEILTSQSESGKLKIRWDKLPDESAYQVTANLEDRYEPGQYGDKITLETNHPTRKQLEVSVLVVVPAPISVAPSKLVLPQETSSPISRTIVLKNPPNSPLTIDKIETPYPSMTSKFEPMGDFGVRVVIGNIQPSVALAGQSVTIHLSNGQVIQVPMELKEKP